MKKSVTIKISNTNSCQQCMQAVSNSIKGLQGIILVTLKPETDRFEVVVSYESGKVSFEKIRNTIVELGYNIDGYIIHEHLHAHGDIFHDHPHTHGDMDKEHYHIHSEDKEVT
ncbi:MAG: cation transporter [Nitrospirae bacterium]|nr:cation transporter [Nitrospirota bacterium]